MGLDRLVEGQPGVDDNTVYLPDDTDETEYESSFGAHVSDGSSSYYAPVASTGGEGMRRNTIKDIFGQDPQYDNFNDEYYYDEVEGYN